MPLILKHLDLLSDIFTNWNLSQKHHVLTCGIINYLSGQTLCALRFWVGPGARLVIDFSDNFSAPSRSKQPYSQWW